MQFAGEITFAQGQFRERGGQLHAAFVAAFGDLIGENVHDCRGQHVHAKEAEIVTGAQAGNDQALFGLGGGRLLDDFGDFVKALAPGHQLASHGPVIGQLAFMRGLDRGHRTVLRRGHLDQLLGTSFLTAADIKVIADEQKKRLFEGEFIRTPDGMSVAERRGLFDELESLAVMARRVGVRRLVARRHHHTDFLRARVQNLLDDNAQRALLRAIAVHECLQRQHALGLARGRYDRLFDFHDRIVVGL